MDTQELLTIKEVATRLKVSVDTVKRRLKDGRLKSIKISDRGRRVSEAALQEYVRSMNEQEQPA